MLKKPLKSDITAQCKKIVEFLSEQDNVDLAYLFGSVAEGKEGTLSDIDLAVLLDESLNKTEMFDLQLSLISELVSILRTDKVDLIVMNDASLSLNYEIIRANHPLLAKDEGKRIDFEHGVMSRYLDRRFYEKRWASEFLKKVSERGI
jgi:predicted nucleotidyltransferase